MIATQQVSQWLAAASTSVKRSASATLTSKVQAGQCLVCAEPATRRGLCGRHYLMFRRKLTALPTLERVAFEERQIYEGRILPSGAVREMKREDPFA